MIFASLLKFWDSENKLTNSARVCPTLFNRDTLKTKRFVHFAEKYKLKNSVDCSRWKIESHQYGKQTIIILHFLTSHC